MSLRNSFWLVLLISGFFSAPLSGQGWERIIPEIRNDLNDQIILPDGSTLVFQDRFLHWISPEGRLTRSQDNLANAYTNGPFNVNGTLTEAGELLQFARVLPPDTPRLIQTLLTPGGDTLDVRSWSLPHGPIDTSLYEDDFPLWGETTKLGNGKIISFRSYEKKFDNAASFETFDNFFLWSFDPEREVGHSFQPDVLAERWQWQELIPITDTDILLLLRMDTLFNGETTVDQLLISRISFAADIPREIYRKYWPVTHIKPIAFFKSDSVLTLGSSINIQQTRFAELNLSDGSLGEPRTFTLFGGQQGVTRDAKWLPDGSHIQVRSSNNALRAAATLIHYSADGEILSTRGVGPRGLAVDKGTILLSRLPNGELFVNFNAFEPWIPVPGYTEGIITGRLDASLTSFRQFIRGRVRGDLDGDGIGDQELDGLRWWIRAIPRGEPNRDTLYTQSDEAGNFLLRADTGRYVVETVLPNAYWVSAPSETLVELAQAYDTATVDLLVEPLAECPLLTVETSLEPLYTCDTSRLTVNYFNQGTAAANSARLEVVLDPKLTPVVFSTPTWEEARGDTLVFRLADIPVGTRRSLSLPLQLACDVPFRAGSCVEAFIYPDTLCGPFSSVWDGSSIEVSGACLGDSVRFRIINRGADMTAPLQYVITEDLVIHRGNDFQLESQEELLVTVAAEGAVYQLFAQQPPGHPIGNIPTALVTGCGQSPVDTTGLIGQYPYDFGNPFSSIICGINFGAPGSGMNSTTLDKSGNPEEVVLVTTPSGLGPERLVDTGTTFRLTVLLQNRDTLPIFHWQLSDTLTEYFDPSTMRLLGGSHDFTLEVAPRGHFYLSADDMELGPGRRAYAELSLTMRPGLSPGTRIPLEMRSILNRSRQSVAAAPPLTVRKPRRYAFTEIIDCTEGLEAGTVLRTLDTLSLPTYDSVHLTTLREVPSYRFEIDTTHTRGDTVFGQLILSDTTLIRELSTVYGCDSVLNYRIMVVLSATENREPAEVVQLYPNPATDYLVVSTTGHRLSELEIRDALGRRVPVAQTAAGDRLLDLSRLPPGTYTLIGRSDGRPWARRFLKR